MSHKHSWDLIPWFVNGSIPEAKRRNIERHLEECAACREEVAMQRAIVQAMRTRPLVESLPHGSLQKLWSRIDAQPLAPRRGEVRADRPPRAVSWLAAAIAAQALLLGALTIVLLKAPHVAEEAAEFRTVSSPAPAAVAPSVRAVFSPSMTLGELQALLERSRLRIVDGPSPDGVYALATVSAADDPKQAVLALRAHPAVRFAEAIGP